MDHHLILLSLHKLKIQRYIVFTLIRYMDGLVAEPGDGICEISALCTNS